MRTRTRASGCLAVKEPLYPVAAVIAATACPCMGRPLGTGTFAARLLGERMVAWV